MNNVMCHIFYIVLLLKMKSICFCICLFLFYFDNCMYKINRTPWSRFYVYFSYLELWNKQAISEIPFVLLLIYLLL